MVFAKTWTLAGSAPFAVSAARDSVPSANAPDAPRTILGTTRRRIDWRHLARWPRSWLDTSNRYGTQFARAHTIAAWEAKVLHPETTTTSGRSARNAATMPGVTG